MWQRAAAALPHESESPAHRAGRTQVYSSMESGILRQMPVIRLPVANTVSLADGNGKLTHRDEGEQNCSSPPQSRQFPVTASSGMLAPYQRAHHAEKSPASYLHECSKPHAFLLRKNVGGRKFQCPDCEGDDPLRLPDVAKLLTGELRPLK
jgi:hypothetical protein